jgi:hypothetical protein
MSTGNEDIPRLEVEHTEVPLPELPDLVDKVCPPTTVVYSAVLRDVRIGTTDVAVYDPEVG